MGHLSPTTLAQIWTSQIRTFHYKGHFYLFVSGLEGFCCIWVNPHQSSSPSYYSPLPLTAGNLLTLLVNGLELCDPLGDRNVWGSLFELTEEGLNHGAIMLATKVRGHCTFNYPYTAVEQNMYTAVLLCALECYSMQICIYCTRRVGRWAHLHRYTFPKIKTDCVIFVLVGSVLYLLCESLSWTVLPSSPTCPGGPTTNWQASPHSWQSWRPLGNSNKMLVTQTLHTLTVYKHTVAVYNTCYVCIDVFSWPPIVFVFLYCFRFAFAGLTQ